MHENIVKMQMECNAWTLRIIETKPIPKICKNLFKFEKPQIFQQTPKFRSQKMKCMINEQIRDTSKEENALWD